MLFQETIFHINGADDVDTCAFILSEDGRSLRDYRRLNPNEEVRPVTRLTLRVIRMNGHTDVYHIDLPYQVTVGQDPESQQIFQQVVSEACEGLHNLRGVMILHREASLQNFSTNV